MRAEPESLITKKFVRAPVDVDDTIPVALFTMPYERIDVAAESAPYEQLVLELHASANLVAADLPPPSPTAPPSPRTVLALVLAVGLLAGALALGTTIGFLVF